MEDHCNALKLYKVELSDSGCLTPKRPHAATIQKNTQNQTIQSYSSLDNPACALSSLKLHDFTTDAMLTSAWPAQSAASSWTLLFASTSSLKEHGDNQKYDRHNRVPCCR